MHDQAAENATPGSAGELETALRAVRKASQATEDAYRDLVHGGNLEKGDRSPVTVADFASQAIAVGELLRAFPDATIVGEEDSKQLRSERSHLASVLGLVRRHFPDVTEARLLELIDLAAGADGGESDFWTLDPIDGTMGFLRGDQYAVALALLKGGKPVLGVLGCPRLPAADLRGAPPTGALLYAVKGKGAYVCGPDGSSRRKVAVDTVTNPAEARMCEPVEKEHGAHELHARIASRLGMTSAPHRMDSQAKYAAVARGDASLYLRLPARPGYREAIWDHAAGALIVEEAGGRVTDIEGKALDFSRGRRLEGNAGVVVSNARIHGQVLQAIARSLP